MLEAGGPLAFLGAQALYVVGPALAPFAPEDDVLALAQLFEDPASVQALAERLTEEGSSHRLEVEDTLQGTDGYDKLSPLRGLSPNTRRRFFPKGRFSATDAETRSEKPQP